MSGPPPGRPPTGPTSAHPRPPVPHRTTGATPTGIFTAYPAPGPYAANYSSRRSSGLVDGVVVSLLLGLGVGVAVYAARAPVARAVILGITVAAALLVLLRSGGQARDPIARWRRPVITRSSRSLVRRWQVLRFDRLVGPAPALVSDVRDRMRRILAAELERQSVDFDSDEARRLLGGRAHQLLSGPVDRRVGAGRLRELIQVSARICPPTPTVDRGRGTTKGPHG